MKNKKLWFRAKTFGWGWYPVSWQGWLTTAVYTVYLLFISGLIGKTIEGRAGVTSFLFLFFLGTIPMMIVCYKTGEEPRWRWGNKK